MKLGPKQQKWVDALRSGKYGQTVSQLQRDDCYCCLGVACVVSDVECNLVEGELVGEDLSSQLEVADQLKLAHPSGGTIDGKSEWLVDLNDVHHKSFAEIADILEKKPCVYFKESA